MRLLLIPVLVLVTGCGSPPEVEDPRPSLTVSPSALMAREARPGWVLTQASPQAAAHPYQPTRASRKKAVSRSYARPGGSVWDRLAWCESTGRWHHDGRYDGGLQFHPSTWRRYGGTRYAAYAWQATREQQIEIAKKCLASEGWGAWPHCSRKIGVR